MKTAIERASEAIEAAEKVFFDEMGAALDLSPAAKMALIVKITAVIRAAVAEERNRLISAQGASRSGAGANPHFSYRLFLGSSGAVHGSEGRGCRLNRRISTSASPVEGSGPRGVLPGFWSVSVRSGERGMRGTVFGLVGKGRRHSQLDAAHAGAHQRPDL